MNIDDFLAAPKPRAKPRRLEDDLHLRVAKYLRAVIGFEGDCHNGVAWESIEIRGRRSPVEGARNKARGCVQGTPDIHLCHNGLEYHIELKSDDGRLSGGQKDWHAGFGQAGARIVVCRSIDDVRAALATWHIPTRELTK